MSELRGGPEVVAAHAARISFHEVIVLGYRDALPIDQADSRTLLTLLAFNQVRQGLDVGPVRIVAEMLDQRNAALAEATGVDDFVVSDELTSLMLAQLSERAELGQVFDDLFDRSGLLDRAAAGRDVRRRRCDVLRGRRGHRLVARRQRDRLPARRRAGASSSTRRSRRRCRSRPPTR